MGVAWCVAWMLLASNTPDECRVMKMEERLYLKRNAVLAREDNKANGTFTSLPMMFNFIFKLSWGVLMDKLKKRKILTRTLGVKISQCFREFLPESSEQLLVPIYSNVWGGARSHPCGPVRHMPRTGSRALPILSQQHVSRSSHKGSIEEWNNLFLLTALMCIFSGVIFAIFGSGDLQEFAKSRKENMAEDGNLLSPLQAGTLRADSVSML
ncbi:hypothetical protein NECAME_02114 [Necator americanus]|uniref:Uncharacterized protein n=1 Tax=Necator americanus TaxID=51031 RepID=W2TIM6_NECAM|nr:hypothetical protein NECAME_02114 [Necator americanus]ETN81434.1 hypothetical protein NECAME_02114 [Necator americanus]